MPRRPMAPRAMQRVQSREFHFGVPSRYLRENQRRPQPPFGHGPATRANLVSGADNKRNGAVIRRLPIRRAPVDVIMNPHLVAWPLAHIGVAIALPARRPPTAIGITDQVIPPIMPITARPHPAHLRNGSSRRAIAPRAPAATAKLPVHRAIFPVIALGRIALHGIGRISAKSPIHRQHRQNRGPNQQPPKPSHNAPPRPPQRQPPRQRLNAPIKQSRTPKRSPNNQKFFVSFFQKRKRFLF